SNRVYDRLKKLKASPETPVWLIDDDETVSVESLGGLIEAGKEELESRTVLLPPSAGGLFQGLLVSDSPSANDVADVWLDEHGSPRRRRDVWDDEPRPKGMRLVRTIDTKPDAEESERNADDESMPRRFWHWFEQTKGGDGDGSKSNKLPVLWQVH